MKKSLSQKKSWEKLSHKIVHENPWYHIAHEKFVTPNHTEGNYFIMRPHGTCASVVIIPVDKDEIVFVRQYRYIVKKKQLELPMGGVEMGHTPVFTARKELREELGYTVKKMKKIGMFYPYNGPLDEKCYVFLAEGLEKTLHDREDTEIGMTEERYKINDVFTMIEKGRISDGQTIAALAMARNVLV